MYVVDRIKDVVIRGGENVYCAEVEAVLFEHPDVADVAVVGLAEATLGERVCAVVVVRPGRDARPERSALVRGEAAGGVQVPRGAPPRRRSCPKTATEKVAKNVLRDRLGEPGVTVEQMW